jgi:hypothetical protein
MDIRHPNHSQHSQALRLRGEISFSLQHSTNLKEFSREDVPPATTCATSHAKMTALLSERDMEEHTISVILFSITVDAPTPQVEAQYAARTKRVYAINRVLFQAYVEFLTPFGTRPDLSPTTSPTEQPQSSASRACRVREKSRQPCDNESANSNTRRARAPLIPDIPLAGCQLGLNPPNALGKTPWRWAKVPRTHQGSARQALYLAKLNISSWTPALPTFYFVRKILIV